MPVSSSARFAGRTLHMQASAIRELLKLTQLPDVISFAGGLPAPELFPTEAIAECTREVMDEYGARALQYSLTEGIPELRTWAAARMQHYEADDVLIVNGSQQALDLIGKILIDPGDHVVLEHPSYLGALQAFNAYEARYLTAETDEDGVIPESLEALLEKADPFPKFLYLIPSFQNPTGRTLARDRREKIVRICERFDLPIVEDNPYGELRFEGEHLPSLASFETTSTILSLGTGSKIMAPGLRVAWVATTDEEVREKIVLAKQGADLQPGTLSQYIFHRYVSRTEEFAAHLRRIIDTYRRRRDVMHEALARFMPPGVRFNKPQGGMFLWASVPGIDTEQLLVEAAKMKIAFVPGVSFYPHHEVTDSMRLNFSNSSEEKISEGIERLAKVILEGKRG